jgi:hypothetical protein
LKQKRCKMKIIQEGAANYDLVTASLTGNEKEKQSPPKSQQRQSGKGLVLNVGFAESLKRGLITVFLPWIPAFGNPYLLISIASVMSCLLTIAVTRFCFVRYAWQHWIRHLPRTLQMLFENHVKSIFEINLRTPRGFPVINYIS